MSEDINYSFNKSQYNSNKYYIENLLKKCLNYQRIKTIEDLSDDITFNKKNKHFLFFDLGTILGANKVFNGDTHHSKNLKKIIIEIINKYVENNEEYYNFMFFTKKISGIDSNYTHSNSDENIFPIPINLECDDNELGDHIDLSLIDISVTSIFNFKGLETSKKKMDLFNNEEFVNLNNNNFSELVNDFPRIEVIERLKNFEHNFNFLMRAPQFHKPTSNVFSHLKILFEKLHAIISTDDACQIRRYLIFKNEFKYKTDHYFEFFSGDNHKITDLNVIDYRLLAKEDRFSECKYFFPNNLDYDNNNYQIFDNFITNFNVQLENENFGFSNHDIGNITKIINNKVHNNFINHNGIKNDIEKNIMIEILNNNFVRKDNYFENDNFNNELFTDILKAYSIEKIFFQEDPLRILFNTFIPPVEEHNVFYALEQESGKKKFKVIQLNEDSEPNKIFTNIYINSLNIPST